MEENYNYDVAIMGSGIGGLCAGALLAKDGYKVLVAEKRSKIGGRWSTEDFEGFKLPTGSIVIHQGSIIDQIFEKLGEKMQGVVLDKLYYRIRGVDYDVSGKGAVGMMLEIANKIEMDRARVGGRLAKEVAVAAIKGAFKKGVMEPEKEKLGITFKEWLSQYTDNEDVHAVYDVISTALMTVRISEIPAAQLFSFFAKMAGMKAITIAPRGNVENAEILAGVIRKRGNVWTDCPVKGIIIDNGKAKGIVIQRESKDIEINSRVVISNIGVRETVELVGEKPFGANYLDKMKRSLRPSPCILNLIASDKPLWLENGEHGSLVVVGARRITGVIPITNSCPELSPPGQYLTYCIGAPQASGKMDIEEEIKQNTLDIKEHLPDFEKHGRILQQQVHDVDSEFPECRTWPGYDMPRETPVENLYHVGDAVKSLGWSGTSAAAESGNTVYEIVKKRIKPATK